MANEVVATIKMFRAVAVDGIVGPLYCLFAALRVNKAVLHSLLASWTTPLGYKNVLYFNTSGMAIRVHRFLRL